METKDAVFGQMEAIKVCYQKHLAYVVMYMQCYIFVPNVASCNLLLFVLYKCCDNGTLIITCVLSVVIMIH